MSALRRHDAVAMDAAAPPWWRLYMKIEIKRERGAEWEEVPEGQFIDHGPRGGRFVILPRPSLRGSLPITDDVPLRLDGVEAVRAVQTKVELRRVTLMVLMPQGFFST